jgi:hypothetical protein
MDLPVKYDGLHWSRKKKVREEYVTKQGGYCYHCKGKLSEAPPHKISFLRINRKLFPQGFFKHPIHLHHCHKNGMTIGAVHAVCNAVLWQYHGE